MTVIIALCGKKQSGKGTLSNFIHGYEMLRSESINRFSIHPETGELFVNFDYTDENGRQASTEGFMDLSQRNHQFYRYAEDNIWPFVRAYNFADSLKEICMTLFRIPYECLYGTDEQKNQVQEHLLWENMPGNVKIDKDYTESLGNAFYTIAPRSRGPMTAREFMQFFGTDVMRKIYEPVWVNDCISRIVEDAPPIAVISDCRFVNEAKAVQDAGGKVIRLKRSIHESSHESEMQLDRYDKFDSVIENQSMTIEESCESLLEELVRLGCIQRMKNFGSQKRNGDGEFTTSPKRFELR
jgi:hypothetical protein